MASERVARSKRSANAFLAGAVWVLIFVCGTAHAQDYLTQTGSPSLALQNRGARRLRANERNLRILDVDSGKLCPRSIQGTLQPQSPLLGKIEWLAFQRIPT